MFLISRAQRVGLFQFQAGLGQVLVKIRVAGGYLIYFWVLLGSRVFLVILGMPDISVISILMIFKTESGHQVGY